MGNWKILVLHTKTPDIYLVKVSTGCAKFEFEVYDITGEPPLSSICEALLLYVQGLEQTLAANHLI